MNRKILLLNLLLLALIATVAWSARVRWQQGLARERAFLLQAAKLTIILPPAPPAPVKPTVPADFLEVAQRTLFSKDRNPTVVVEVPAPKPEPPVPPMPQYHGQMSFGEPVALLSLGADGQKSYRIGQKIGEFKLVALTSDSLTLEWNDKKFEKKLADLAPKEAQQQPTQATVATPAVQAVTSLGSNSKQGTELKSPQLGTDMGGGFRACVGGDNSPPGTVIDGYKKMVTQSLMGQTCRWEQVK